MIFYKVPSESTSYRVYLDNIGTATITAATAPGTVDNLTIGAITPDNLSTPRSVIVPVSGGQHGDISQVMITFTLSTGGPLKRPITVRVSNS